MKLVYFVYIYSILIEIIGLNYKTKPGFGFGDQDFGYVDVRLGAHMFWWIQFAMNKSVEEAATILWLPGGPGTSSTGMGNIGSVGPTTWAGSYRSGNWAEKYNLLFIDSPVGSGFSYVDHEDYFNKNSAEMIRDLYKTIEFLMIEHPELQKFALYPFCNSYAAKICVEFGTLLYNKIQAKKIVCNFRGIFLSNGYIGDKDSAVSFNILQYIWGFIDKQMYNELNRLAKITKKSSNDGLILQTIDNDKKSYEYLKNCTNGTPILLLYKVNNKPEECTIHGDDYINKRFDYTKIDGTCLDSIMNGPVKRALNISERIVWGKARYLLPDFVVDFTTSKDGFVEYLLQYTDIKIYMNVASADGVVPPSSVLNWLKLIDWPGKRDFVEAKREMIWVDGILQGYKKTTQQIGFYWLLKAGHMAFYDNPFGTMDMLTTMIGY